MGDESDGQAGGNTSKGETMRDKNDAETMRDENDEEVVGHTSKGETMGGENDGETMGDESDGQAGGHTDQKEKPWETRMMERPWETRVMERPWETRVMERPWEMRMMERPRETRVMEGPWETRVMDRPEDRHTSKGETMGDESDGETMRDENDEEVVGKTSKRVASTIDELEKELSDDDNRGDVSIEGDEDEESSSGESNCGSEMDEFEIIRDCDMKEIFVTRVTKSTTTKKGKKKRTNRVYNGRNSCPFCSRLVANFSTHIFGHRHEKEPAVCKIRGTTEEKERKRLIRLLRNRGNNIHNCRVLKEKKGEMLLSRRIGTE